MEDSALEGLEGWVWEFTVSGLGGLVSGVPCFGPPYEALQSWATRTHHPITHHHPKPYTLNFGRGGSRIVWWSSCIAG